MLLEQFHKNRGYGSYERTVAGLEYLTMPITYEGKDYLPLNIRGSVDTRCGLFSVLYSRLDVLIAHVRGMLSLASSEWTDFALINEFRNDKRGTQWKDIYFSAKTEEDIRSRLNAALVLLRENEECFYSDEDGACAPFHKYVALILRELEDTVEHFL